MPNHLLSSLFAAGALIIAGLAVGTPALAEPTSPGTDDPTVRVDPSGRVYYVDPGPQAPPRKTPAPRINPRTTAPASTVPVLSSLPGSRRTVHLDFNGRNVTGEAWEAEGITGFRSGFNLEGPASTFSSTELAAIREIWERVSETYAPFDVNVTTVDPGRAAINRSDKTDRNFGVRMVITHDPVPHARICGGACAGAAYIDVFDDRLANKYRTGWVFSEGASDEPALIAHSASHEVGHTLSLGHDGQGLAAYYFGTPVWGPLMGGGSGSAVVQFSRGDYPGANNRESDLAKITSSGLSRRPDIGNTPATARDLGNRKTYSYRGHIHSGQDVDVLKFTHACTDPIVVRARGPERGQTLDISLTLRDAAQKRIRKSNPAAVRNGAFVAAGMDASLRATPTKGPYYLTVDGVGSGTPPNGWSAYGSIGSYHVTISSCGAPPETRTPPSAPTSVKLVPAVDGATLSWQPPARSGTHPVTGYRIALGGVTKDFSTSTRSVKITGLARNTSYTVVLRAISKAGAGKTVTRQFTTR